MYKFVSKLILNLHKFTGQLKQTNAVNIFYKPHLITKDYTTKNDIKLPFKERTFSLISLFLTSESSF